MGEGATPGGTLQARVCRSQTRGVPVQSGRRRRVRGLWTLWVLLLWGCGSPSGEGAPTAAPAGGSASGAAGAATTWDPSCGDAICSWDESCQSCASDCGACEVQAEPRRAALFFTTPSFDAAVALADETRGDLERQLLRDLDAAHASIELALYDVTRAPVLDALLRATQRGVSVRIVTECEHRSGTRARLLQQLESSGVPIAHDRSSFGGLAAGCPEAGGQMHHKFVLVDRRLVWVGSANLTATDLNYNHNHMLRLVDERAADVFFAEWEEMFLGRFGRDKQERAAISLEIDGSHIEVGFSPRRSADGSGATRGLVLGALANAEDSVELALFAFTDQAVAERLAAVPARVRGIVDASQVLHESSRVRPLCEQGTALVVENLPGKVHHKLGVVDGAVLVGGSANWSAGGFDQNDETVFVLKAPELAALAAAEVARLLDAPAHVGGSCCFHGAETYDAASPACGERACVCENGLDDDFDGQTDAADSGCAEAFVCTP